MVECGTSIRLGGMLQQIDQHKHDAHGEVLRSFDGTTIAW